MPNEIVIRDGNEDDGGAFDGDLQNVSVADNAGLLPTHISAARKAEIEKIRDTDIDRYFREGLDKEHLQYLKEEMGQLEPTEALLPEQSRRDMMATEAGRKLVQEWDRTSFRQQLTYVQSTVGAFVRGLGDERHQRVFMEKFDRVVPEDLRYAVFDMIVTSSNNAFVKPVTPEQVKLFEGSGGACAELVKKWGKDAPNRIARLWRRAEYLKMFVSDISPIVDFLNVISDDEAKTVTEFFSK